MRTMNVWPLSPWSMFGEESLELSEPSKAGIAYTRGGLEVVGFLNTRMNTLTEWTLPHSLFPDYGTANGPRLPVPLGPIARSGNSLFTSMGDYPGIAEVDLKTNKARVYTSSSNRRALQMPGSVAAAVNGTVWFRGRSSLESGKCVLGVLDPLARKFEVWEFPIGFGTSRALAIEADARGIWTTCVMSGSDGRHALVRLDPKAKEVKYWVLPQLDPFSSNEAAGNARRYGHVVLDVRAGRLARVWWVLFTPGNGVGGRLVELNPVTGQAVDHGPSMIPNDPNAAQAPVSLSLDATRRPMVGYAGGDIGVLMRTSCGQAIQLQQKTNAAKPYKVSARVLESDVQPTVTSVTPSPRNIVPSEDGCFENLTPVEAFYPFGIATGALALDEQARSKMVFVSNGIDRIGQWT